MEFPDFQCSRFGKLRSRSQVIPTSREQMQAHAIFAC
jgi:hypothetical protein